MLRLWTGASLIGSVCSEQSECWQAGGSVRAPVPGRFSCRNDWNVPESGIPLTHRMLSDDKNTCDGLWRSRTHVIFQRKEQRLATLSLRYLALRRSIIILSILARSACQHPGRGDVGWLENSAFRHTRWFHVSFQFLCIFSFNPVCTLLVAHVCI